MSTTYRHKVARLRGVLYSVRFAVQSKDHTELEEMLEEIDGILAETADKSSDTTPALPWKAGCVVYMGEYLRLYEGQVWELSEETMASDAEGHFDRTVTYDVIQLRVVATSPEGEVHLRPAKPQDLALVQQHYPEREYVKGEQVPCPFKVVDAKMVKASKGALLAGDLLCHEAWSVWTEMHPLKSDDPAG